MAHLLRTGVALLLGSLAAAADLIALLLLIAVGATAVASFSYLWYGGDFGTVSFWALSLAAMAGLCYLSAYGLRRARHATEARVLQVRGFEVQPMVPKRVLAPSPNPVGAVPERKE